jgi:hypothetical protein
MVKIALLYDEKTLEVKGLKSLKAALNTSLDSLANLEVVELSTDRATPPPDALSSYDLVVICGYSLSLLSVLFAALESGAKVVSYDLPGDSIERDLNSMLFLGVDAQRFPPSALSQMTYSWNYRDIVGICKQLVKNVPEGATGDLDSPRPVENTRKPSSRKRADAAKAGEDPER